MTMKLMVWGMVMLALSCGSNKKPSAEAPVEMAKSPVDSIAGVDAHLSLLDISLGEKFNKEEYSRTHSLTCSDEGAPEHRAFFRLYKFYYRPCLSTVEVRTNGNNEVYEIELYRINGYVKSFWDSCYNALDPRCSSRMSVGEVFANARKWKYRNQTAIMSISTAYGEESMSIKFTDKNLREAVLAEYQEAKNKTNQNKK